MPNCPRSCHTTTRRSRSMPRTAVRTRASNHGSEPWTRQHPAIEIDQKKDGITDNGQEVWNFLNEKSIKNVIVMGVHTNMCVLGAARSRSSHGRPRNETMLVRDLTDAMYNPARSPYVSHAEGTRLVIEYIEKFWCPTIASEDLVGR